MSEEPDASASTDGSDMSESSEWWQTFFSGVWLNVVGDSLSEEQTHAEADFILARLGVPPGARVLDVPCGEGRLSLEIASRGYGVTGVDVTLPLLEEARTRAVERELAVDWEHRDMRDLAWDEAFDGAFSYWGSFGYFDDAGNRRFLGAVARALRPGAPYLIETHVAESLFPKFQPRSWRRFGDLLLLEERWFDHTRSRVETEWTFVRNSVRETHHSSVRIYTYRELCALLEEAGFADCEGFEPLGGEPFRLGSGRLALVARRK